MDAAIKTLREARQWLGELRRWGTLLGPAVIAGVKRGRAEAKAAKPMLDEPARQVVGALCAMGFKKRPAEIAVRAALAELGPEVENDRLIRAALGRLR